MQISSDIFEDTETAFAHRTNADLYKAKAMFQLVGNSTLVNLGSTLTNLALSFHMPVAPVFKWTVFEQFCGGETFDECKTTIQQLAKWNVGVLLNYGVELKETEEDFDKTIKHNLEALQFGGKNNSVKALCIKLTGFGRFGLFEKVQKGEPLSIQERREFVRIKKRFEKLCDVAKVNKVPLYVDAEESWIQDTLNSFVEEMMQKYNREECVVFNTFQMYRWDCLDYLRLQIEKARKGNYHLGVKLVRGAYMEKERERALENGYPSPIHPNKQAVDTDFDASVNICLDNLEHLFLCIASQSEESNLAAVLQIEKRKIARHSERILFSQLYGMGDNITFNLAKLGFNTTKYLPYGPVKEVIPYLIRRAQENTSVAGQSSRELTLVNREINRRRKK